MCPVPRDTAQLRGAAAPHPCSEPSNHGSESCCHLQLLPRHGHGVSKLGRHLLHAPCSLPGGCASFVRLKQTAASPICLTPKRAIPISLQSHRRALIPLGDRARAFALGQLLNHRYYFTSLLLFRVEDQRSSQRQHPYMHPPIPL